MSFVERELTSEDLDDIQYLFNYVDENKDGLISIDEFKKILIEAEIYLDSDTLYKLIDVINPEKKEEYDINMIVHFFKIRPDEE